MRYLGLQTYAWDLGIYNQAVYTTVFSGKLLYYTADLPGNPTGSLLGIHFSPIMFALSPFYLLNSNPITLLVIQAVVLSLGALPLYYYALARLGERRTATVFSMAYLLSPLTAGVIWFDFHPEAFLPAAFLGALYFSAKRRWFGYFICILVALASIETAPIIAAALGLYLLWTGRLDIAKMSWQRRARSHFLWAPVATILVSAAWLQIALRTIQSLNPVNMFYSGGSSLYWGVLGARTVTEVPLRTVMDPVSAISALGYDWWLKILYVLILFGPLLFLPFRSRSSLLLTLPWLGVALLSSYRPFYIPFNQYPAFVTPFIFAAAVDGFRKLGPSGRHLKLAYRGLRRKLLIMSFLAFVIATPIVPWLMGLVQPSPPYQVFAANSHESVVRELVSLVPPDGSILTQSNIFPLVSSRLNAYVVPIVSFFPPGTSLNATLDSWLNASEYVLLDPVTDPVSTVLTLSRLARMASHGLLAQVQDVMLFRKSYDGSPVRFDPVTRHFDWRNLHLLSSKTVSDSASFSGTVLYHDPGEQGPFWGSSDTWLPKGNYRLLSRIRTDLNWAGALIEISIMPYSVYVVATPIGNSQTGFNYEFSIQRERKSAAVSVFTEGNVTANFSYQDLTITFASNGLESFAVSGKALTNTTGIYLDRLLIEQTP